MQRVQLRLTGTTYILVEHVAMPDLPPARGPGGIFLKIETPTLHRKAVPRAYHIEISSKSLFTLW
jgi:hypothetical protein